MGLLQRIERKLFLGIVYKDYGEIENRREGISTVRTRLFLAHKFGKLQVILKHSSWSFLGGGTTYHYIDPDSFLKLEDILSDVRKIKDVGTH